MKVLDNETWFVTLQTSCHTLFFKWKLLNINPWKLPSFFFSVEYNSVKNSRNDINLLSFKIIRWEQVLINTTKEILCLVVLPHFVYLLKRQKWQIFTCNPNNFASTQGIWIWFLITICRKNYDSVHVFPNRGGGGGVSSLWVS